MRLKIFKYINLREWQGLLLNATAVTSLVVASSYLGFFQILDWALYDQFFVWRSSNAKEIENIVIVTIDDQDVIDYEHPFSDAVLARLLNAIKAQNPQIIGLDIYRDIPVKEGFEALEAVFKTTPNLIGVETISAGRIKPPKILGENNQVGLAELPPDRDGKVRRAIISSRDQDTEKQHLGLATQVALKYLGAQGIYPQVAESTTTSEQAEDPNGEQPIVWGQTTLIPFRGNDGPYVNEDDGGYQILINYVAHPDSFQTKTMAEVMEDKIPANTFTDKIVYIGAIGESLNDFFRSPLDKQEEENANRGIPGVYIHANISAQIINGALYGRPMIKVLSDRLEWGWALVWSIVGTTLSWRVLNIHSLRKRGFPTVLMLMAGVCVSCGALVGLNFMLFQASWWLPFVTPMMGLLMSSLAIAGYRVNQLNRLASLDGLTQVANRRYFDEYLYRTWFNQVGTDKQIAIILCDVDYFKPYNDTYGHQAGDNCLQQVAKAMKDSIRNHDLVARYGGEEFVVVLSKIDEEIALKVAQRINSKVAALAIEHKASKTKSVVTISCGVSCAIPNDFSSPAGLVAEADQALYLAKERGRNQAILHDGIKGGKGEK